MIIIFFSLVVIGISAAVSNERFLARQGLIS